MSTPRSETSIEINKDIFFAEEHEFPILSHDEYNNLIIYPAVGWIERQCGVLNDFSDALVKKNGSKPDLLIVADAMPFARDYNYLVATECIQFFNKVVILDTTNNQTLKDNINKHANVYIYNSYKPGIVNWKNLIVKAANFQDVAANKFLFNDVLRYQPSIMSNRSEVLLGSYSFLFYLNQQVGTENDFTLLTSYLYINTNDYPFFEDEFKYYFQNDEIEKVRALNYDNLLNLCIMVKNGGELFRKTLIDNLPYIDRWTILDTGSTDNTIDIINEVLVGKKKGTLYQEPFINFRESRNRCLDLAGKRCKYNLMLDDTYIVQGELRHFLNTVRGDQFADSFSLLVKSDDTEYYSNRITKSKNYLRYIYTIHEVIQKDDNVNVVVPAHKAWIYDGRAPYMEERTMARKEYDLQCLFDMVKEYPDDPRHLYYIAQTYNLLNKQEEAAEYFKRRAFHKNPGFDQEKIDALFEMTRIYNFKLNKPWEECEKYYQLVHKWDPERPEASYFIGIHYYLEGNMKTAYEYFKRAFEIGFPVHRQYSLKPTLSYHFCPKMLTELCYYFDNFELGLKAANLFLEKNTDKEDAYKTVTNWRNIHSFLLKLPKIAENPIVPSQPIFCFVADGGFNQWKGSSIDKIGVGGSETYIIELSKYIKKYSNYEVVVFCNCGEEEVYEGVKFVNIHRFFDIAATTSIEHCVISRYAEYIPVAFKTHVQNVHVVLHDLGLTGEVIPRDPKLKNIWTLSEWHRDYFNQFLPQFKQITSAFHYGIDFDKFLTLKLNPIKKERSFIYSSFPNRGLSIILEMWPAILQRYPDATLNMFCDLDNTWVNTFHKEEVDKVRKLLKEVTNVKNHGWVDKNTLAQCWKQSDVWFYPCIFQETFCLTALEAAITKTMVISNDLAALQNTVSNRGIVIPGDSTTEQWKLKAFEKICDYFDNKPKYEHLKQKNFEWALTHSWEDRAKEMLRQVTPKVQHSWEDKKQVNPKVQHSLSNFTIPELQHTVTRVEERLYSINFWDKTKSKIPLSNGLEMTPLNNLFVSDFNSLNNSPTKPFKHVYWFMLTAIKEALIKSIQTANFKTIVDIGSSDKPFELANIAIDSDEDIIRICKEQNPSIAWIQVDIDKESLPFSNKSIDFAYCRHTLEDISNPEFAFKEIIRSCKRGYIETPSVMVELSRYIDGMTINNDNYHRGYVHHHFFVWSDLQTNTLHFLPKMAFAEYIDFDHNIREKVNTLLNNYGIYWSNYYVWNESNPPKCIVHSISAKDSPDNKKIFSIQTINNLLNQAVFQTIEYTNKVIQNLLQSN